MAKFTLLAASAFAIFMATSTNAHMIMRTPTPYGLSTLDNSPLVADGSDFPCKQRAGVYDLEGAQNIMAIGEPQTLSFKGSAVHGGGSCQVSLTTDLQPTKSSKWMVIKSIEGGCPASVPGNLSPADPNGDGASTFQYTIPEGITPGQYTIAWSWINKIGNREFYMNCGPATVVAAKKKRYESSLKVLKRQTSFPDMFVANLADVNSCTTPETFDYNYPDPGSDVQSAGTGPYTQLTCGGSGGGAAQQPTATGAAAGAVSTGASGSGSSPGAPSVATSAAGGPGFASNGSPQPTGSPQATEASPGVFATGASSAAIASPTASEVVPVTAGSPATPTGSNSNDSGNNTSGSSSSSSTAAGSESGPCTDEGAWSCSSDGTSFQRCASGVWSVPMSLNGMKCSPGVSDNIALSPAKAKRHMHGHLRRVSNMVAPVHQ